MISNTDESLSDHLPFFNPNMVLMAFDAEGVGTEASDHPFECIDVGDIYGITPGHRIANWWSFMKAKQYLRQKFSKQRRQWTDDKPLEFWRQYSKTLLYTSSENSIVFAPILRSATQIAKAFPLSLLQYRHGTAIIHHVLHDQHQQSQIEWAELSKRFPMSQRLSLCCSRDCAGNS